jgi:hypothetical protein
MVMSGPPPGAFPYGRPLGPPPGIAYFWPPPVAQTEYITRIHPEDVLSGRGGATNSHSGNREFRRLVKAYQEEYLRAKKRDKPAVASVIVDQIREKGGRFLRRCDTDSQGQVMYVDIGDVRAREKTCQALREGAPEIRRKKKDPSSDESDGKLKVTESLTKESEPTLSSSTSSVDASSPKGDSAFQFRAIRAKMTSEDDLDYEQEQKGGQGSDGPIVIRPWSRLFHRRARVEPIPLDQLSSEDRDLYLRDFLPPCPQIRKRRQEPDQNAGADTQDENVNAWQFVSSVPV